jgi:uncharacterized membrane protein
VPAAYLPGGDLADALRAAPGVAAKVKVVLSFLARLRIAPLYVLTVVVIGVVLDHFVSEETRHAVVLANSTNVENLENHRIWTLVTSAFLLDGQLDVGATLGLLLLTAVAELLWGWRRLLEVFFVANAVASCLVYALLRAGVHLNLLDGAITVASDVGTSYGLHAVGGAIAFSLPVRARRILVPLALLAVIVPLLDEHSFTDVGHLLSTLIGFLAGWQMRRLPLAGRVRRPAPLRADRPLAYAFDGPAQARAALTAVLRLQEHHEVHIDDAVVVWSDRVCRVHLRETRDMGMLDAALAGGSWGVVLGTLIGLPVAGLVTGAAGAALVGRWHDAGLTDTTAERTVHGLPPDKAVLLLLARAADQPRLAGWLTRMGGTPIPVAARNTVPPES